jgi:hypothetical protein
VTTKTKAKPSAELERLEKQREKTYADLQDVKR